MRIWVAIGAILVALVAAYGLGGMELLSSNEVVFVRDGVPLAGQVEAPAPPPAPSAPVPGSGDIENQPRLANPPQAIKAMYLTSWTAGSTKSLDRTIALIDRTEINAVVIDIKDYTGAVLYDTGFQQAIDYGAVEVHIPRVNAMLKKLHDKGIYVIARLSTFQDQRLPLARPDVALMSSTTQKQWKDRRGLMWVDTATRDAWEYNVGIAKDALAHGFDEINFDYIRFASDGDLKDIVYPAWDGKTPRATVVKNFWKYLRTSLPGEKISADIFGLTTLTKDDLGIGQVLENALPYFDYVGPMVYPSHYAPGSLGYAEPAKHPYEIVEQSMASAFKRVEIARAKYQAAIATTTPVNVPDEPIAKLRPWLQDFDLGAIYTADMVKAQIQATYDAASTTPDLLSGWMLWDPANTYTEAALGPQG